MFGIPASTLRYYDKAGLFPDLNKAVANIRQFSQDDLRQLRLIECLKCAGLTICEIQKYIELCKGGSETLRERLSLFENAEERVTKQMAQLQDTMKMIQFKKAYYALAIERGSDLQLGEEELELLPRELRDFAREKLFMDNEGGEA